MFFINLYSISMTQKAMMDTSGALILGRGNKSFEVGSLSKLMLTFITLNKLENKVIGLEDKIVVLKKRVEHLNKLLKLNKKGEFTVKDLLTALILFADNGAALELKSYIESEEDFINLMNNIAQKEGLYDTFFNSVTGYGNNSSNYSTAYDIAKLTTSLINNPIYMEILKKAKKIKAIRNKIFMLRDDVIKGEIYPLASSYVEKRGYSLVAYGEVNEIKLVFVILNSDFAVNRDKEIQSMINYASNHLEGVMIGRRGDVVLEIPLLNNRKKLKILLGKDLIVTLPLENAEPSKIVKVYSSISAPIFKGEKVGEIEIRKNGKRIGLSDLVAAEDVIKDNVLKRIISFLTFGIF